MQLVLLGLSQQPTCDFVHQIQRRRMQANRLPISSGMRKNRLGNGRFLHAKPCSQGSQRIDNLSTDSAFLTTSSHDHLVNSLDREKKTVRIALAIVQELAGAQQHWNRLRPIPMCMPRAMPMPPQCDKACNFPILTNCP